MKEGAAHTFSPFGPVLPGSPGGPCTIETRSEERTCLPEAGLLGREPGRVRGSHRSSLGPCVEVGLQRPLAALQPIPCLVLLLLDSLGTVFPAMLTHPLSVTVIVPPEPFDCLKNRECLLRTTPNFGRNPDS